MNKYLYFRDLIKIIQANKQLFLERIAPNPNNLEYFMSEDVPKMVCAATNEPAIKVPLKSITANLQKDSDCNIYFVEFDDSFVTQSTDCYAIAISVDPQDSIRVFTYEKGEHFDGSPAYYVGEFDIKGNHINYGTTSECRVSLFCGKVVEQLNR